MPDGKCNTSWAKTSNKKCTVQDYTVTKFRSAVSAVFPPQSAFGKDFSIYCRCNANSQASSLPLSKEKLMTDVYETWATGQSWANKRAQGKEMRPTREMERTAIRCSQSLVIIWDSLGKRCARLTNFNENTGIQFPPDSKTFLTWLPWLNPVGRWLRHLWTPQLCLLHGVSLRPVTLPLPH